MRLEHSQSSSKIGARILIIEDESTIAELLRTGLTYEGFRVSVVSGGEEGLECADKEDFDLVILDLMLPDIDGFEICRRLRLRGNDIPIIMLTARREIPDRIKGLNMGADDYVTKPFSFEELVARIRAVLRRRGSAAEPTQLSAADITLDLEAHEAYKGGKPLELTPTEFALLELFLRHPRRVFTRETLLNRIWGLDYEGDRNVVDVHISNLRRKLGDRERRLIRTIYGIGYSFRPD
jgi:DNA-binding response OmpR family regulator